MTLASVDGSLPALLLPASAIPADATFAAGNIPMELAVLPEADTWIAVHDGAVAGYAGLVRGEPGFAHMAIYLAPDARAAGAGWRFCHAALALARAWAGQQGVVAIAVNATRRTQARLALALGFEFGRMMLGRGPVLVLRLSAAARYIPAGTIARACFPEAFAAQAEILAQPGGAALLESMGSWSGERGAGSG